MTIKRLLQNMPMYFIIKTSKRVEYLRRHKIYGMIGKDVTLMDRKIPLYPNLIHIHNNVVIGSNVTLATHDGSHLMLNKKVGSSVHYKETIGCIEIMDNVFIGTNVTILNNVRIGSNSIVAAGAVVTKDVPPNTVVGGVPAKVICTIEEYLERRKNNYSDIMRPKGQAVSKELADYMWAQFIAARK